MRRGAGRGSSWGLAIAAIVLAAAGMGKVWAGGSPGALARQILEATGIRRGRVLCLGGEPSGEPVR